MDLAPIILFVYNRPWHTEQTIEALKKNELANESELFIFSDGPKNEKAVEKVTEVRNYIKKINGFKNVTVIEREKNFGLAVNIIDGVTSIVNRYGTVIVLEDDLVTSPYFLKFMNKSLDFYQNADNVACVHGYMYPIINLPDVFFVRGADCWGWATWKRAWDIFEPDGIKLLQELTKKNLKKEADFNNTAQYTKMLKDQIRGKNNSWAIRWYMSAFLNGMLCYYPGRSYVQNIGNDDSGTHCKLSRNYQVNLQSEFIIQKIEPVENLEARKKMEIYFNSINNNLMDRILYKLKRYFYEKIL